MKAEGEEANAGPDVAGDLSPWAVRPLVHFRQKPYADSGELFARTFPEHVPLRPVLGKAVLKDLSWLASYLRAASEEVSGLRDVRQALEALIRTHAPTTADEWLSVPFLDEPVRWEFRVRVPGRLGQALNRILLPVMTWGHALGGATTISEAREEVTKIALAELSMAREVVPVWEAEVSKVEHSFSALKR